MKTIIEVDPKDWDETVEAYLSPTLLSPSKGNLLAVECICGLLKRSVASKCKRANCSGTVTAFRGSEFAKKFFSDMQRVALSSKWFHATIDPEWEKTLQELDSPVHVGTDKAANEMGEGYLDTAGGYFLYEVGLTPSATVASHLCPDSNNRWSQTMEIFHDRVQADFISYLNLYEGIGDVSLVGDSSYLEVIGKKWVPLIPVEDSIELLQKELLNRKSSYPEWLLKQEDKLLTVLTSEVSLVTQKTIMTL